MRDVDLLIESGDSIREPILNIQDSRAELIALREDFRAELQVHRAEFKALREEIRTKFQESRENLEHADLRVLKEELKAELEAARAEKKAWVEEKRAEIRAKKEALREAREQEESEGDNVVNDTPADDMVDENTTTEEETSEEETVVEDTTEEEVDPIIVECFVGMDRDDLYAETDMDRTMPAEEGRDMMPYDREGSDDHRRPIEMDDVISRSDESLDTILEDQGRHQDSEDGRTSHDQTGEEELSFCITSICDMPVLDQVATEQTEM